MALSKAFPSTQDTRLGQTQGLPYGGEMGVITPDDLTTSLPT